MQSPSPNQPYCIDPARAAACDSGDHCANFLLIHLYKWMRNHKKLSCQLNIISAVLFITIWDRKHLAMPVPTRHILTWFGFTLNPGRILPFVAGSHLHTQFSTELFLCTKCKIPQHQYHVLLQCYKRKPFKFLLLVPCWIPLVESCTEYLLNISLFTFMTCTHHKRMFLLYGLPLCLL